MGSRDRVRRYLQEAGVDVDIREFEESTKNSALAAQALGCEVAEIAKSVVFVGGQPVVVVLSGDMKVDSARLEVEVGAPLRLAKADEVRAMTGYPIGGVPPFPHGSGVKVLLDLSLTRFQRVWAAAGAPSSVFSIWTEDLIRLVGEGPREIAMSEPKDIESVSKL